MASRLVLVVLMFIIPTITARFKDHIVGDEAGWRLGFDYQAWANAKKFHVGDKLVFKYGVGSHNVYKVNGTGFQNCIRPPLSEALTTGNDTVVLATPGRKWYICGVGKHCENGMKFAITVFPLKEKTPSPPTPPLTYGKTFIVGDGAGWKLGFDYQAWAYGKKFQVGDKLVFNYPVGAHNVHKVNGTGFQNCIRPPLSEALTTGSDTVVLATPGRKWYICGVGQHCQNGMKLLITVFPRQKVAAPTPSPPLTYGKEFIVGDEAGWRLGFDYQAWAYGKKFQVGDKLVFKYGVGAHNVFKVNGTQFQGCISPPAKDALSSGYDTIVLATPGNKWYICGVGQHCQNGMKLALTVMPRRH
ncbi:blue copper protein-like [Euphorbia lathyris]|uniref:blue copper protein-like n=1 Tax=Euphorbia lathyris TaxID=212925 RepID=UPI003313803A